MGLLRTLLLAPVSGPLKGTLWITGKIHEAATAELNDPAAIRKALRSLEEALLRGEITEEDYDEAEEALLGRLMAQGG